MYTKFIFYYFQNKPLFYWKNCFNRRVLNNLRFINGEQLLYKRSLFSEVTESIKGNAEKNEKEYLSKGCLKNMETILSTKKKEIPIANQQYVKKETKENEEKKKENVNETKKENDKSSWNWSWGWYWDWEKIKIYGHFTKKLLISSCIIYILNNYLFDITLTAGSSMYPLISKGGVILFYICNDALIGFNRLHNLYIDLTIYFWKLTYYITNSFFSEKNSSHYKNKILKKINHSNQKRKKNKNVYSRGDVIILHSPVNTQKKVCKRVIAIENDRIYVKHPNVFVQIPKNSVWVEGDNKEESYDSRNYGSVPTNMIIGRVFFLFDPFTKFLFIKNKNYVLNRERFEQLAD